MNDGTNWNNAWESFGSINWTSVTPGDTVYISGGNDSTIYNETLSFASSSGTEGNQIIVTAAKDTGHNGKVIIDGNNTLSHGVYFDNLNDYITIDGIYIRNTTGYAIIAQDGWTGSYGAYFFKQDHHIGIQVKNCNLYLSSSAGIALKGVENYYGSGNVITTTTYSPTGTTDGYWVQACTNTVIDGDSIIISNTNPTPHCDGIQLNQDTSTTIKNCYIEHTDNKSSNSQHIFSSEGFGDIVIYNNIINMGTSSSNGISIRQVTIGNYNSITIVGNTIYGNSSNTVDHGIWITEFAGIPTIKNNILAYYNQPGSGITSVSYSETSNNLLYNTTGINGSNVITSDPLFVNRFTKDFKLQPGSPAIDEGTYLGSPFNLDKIGNTRSNPPDIGAYELSIGGGSGNIPPNQPTNPNPAIGAVNQNTNTAVSWSCSDPNGDPLTYDVYFGTTNNPPLVSGNLTGTSYNPGELDSNTTYYWKIVAKDNQGGATAGPEWSFSTLVNGGNTSSVNANIMVYLDGPYTDDAMSTDLAANSLIPSSQPYNQQPWNYAGSENVSTFSQNIVDWVLVELRTGTGSSTIVARRAALLKK